MPRTLDVYLRQNLVGQLVQDEDGRMGYKYAEGWLNNPLAIPLSHSLPLRPERFNRKECRGFFAGILPEQDQRKTIARNLGISAENDFAMLEQIGGECAGAVTFIPAGESLPSSNDQYRALSSHELAEILRTLPRRPLMAGEKGIRLSLAGAQDKIAVRVHDGKISVPLGGAASTHILKPAIERFEGLVFNEFLCMTLAQSIGLSTAKVEIGNIEDIDYLLVERYDRSIMPRFPGGPEYLKREHQEDFCQALGIVPEHKYQKEDGPSLKQCFALVREVSSAPVIDLQSLLDAVIYNCLIGNHDAHGKNFSFLYSGETLLGQQTRLAPFYDLVSTVYYPELSEDMAMKIGGEYLSDRILPKHFEKLAEEAGLAKPMVRRRVPELAEMIVSKLAAVTTQQPIAVAVAKLIQGRCEQTIRKFKE
jgi:serine/threonine-protein kinase HipA